ncbi:uncharacterized protein A4U43_C07F34150 [Asparagus officinalis]|uniref:PORR domain-containing protein n=2 Tax=Asparagus officinalis TaxID=4686 RepID=A0A5P1EGW8_ASPOF|nr:uncharacterized protein A4U43_C07F34150 [Asparagus officinalis]
MLSPRRRLPLSLIHRIRFDLGLPPDFARSLLPLFPDYFQLIPSSPSDSTLSVELVCYISDLAQSAMERYAAKTGGYKKGAPLAFPLKFSRGFEMEKKVRKWVEEWQRLPYVSPYEDGSRLPPKSDVWEKWAVGLVHEILSLVIGRKMEKGNLEMVVGCLGLNPARFRRLVMNHAGVFYVSNKIRRQTVVLREGYRRDLLLEKHPLMGLRYQYIHLMRKGKEESGKKKGKGKKKGGRRSVGEADDEVGEDEDGDDDEDEDEEEGDDYSEEFDSEDEESDDEDEDEGYDGSRERVMEGRRGVRVENIEPRRSLVKESRGMNGRRHEGQRKNDGEGRSYGRGNNFAQGKQRVNLRNMVST